MLGKAGRIVQLCCCVSLSGAGREVPAVNLLWADTGEIAPGERVEA